MHYFTIQLVPLKWHGNKPPYVSNTQMNAVSYTWVISIFHYCSLNVRVKCWEFVTQTYPVGVDFTLCDKLHNI